MGFHCTFHVNRNNRRSELMLVPLIELLCDVFIVLQISSSLSLTSSLNIKNEREGRVRALDTRVGDIQRVAAPGRARRGLAERCGAPLRTGPALTSRKVALFDNLHTLQNFGLCLQMFVHVFVTLSKSRTNQCLRSIVLS